MDFRLTPFLAAADVNLLSDRARQLGLEVPLQAITAPGDAITAFATALPVLDTPLPRPVTAGAPDASSADAVLASIETGVDLVAKGQACAVVTNPINKALLYNAGFEYSGHTDYLGALANAHGREASPVMMLVCDALRVVPATVHVPLARVPEVLDAETIIHTIRETEKGLKTLFGIAEPRIAVTGLNPHAGEDGALGGEEIATITPALEALRAEGVQPDGPASGRCDLPATAAPNL